MAIDGCGFNVALKEELRKQVIERERGLRTDSAALVEVDAAAPSHPHVEPVFDYTKGFPTLSAKEALRKLAIEREKGLGGSWF